MTKYRVFDDNARRTRYRTDSFEDAKQWALAHAGDGYLLVDLLDAEGEVDYCWWTLDELQQEV